MTTGERKTQMEDYKKYFDGLSDDLKKKVTECRTSEELMNLAKTEGIELTDDQLDAISGGSAWSCDEDDASNCSEHSVAPLLW